MNYSECPFCEAIIKEDNPCILSENNHAFAIRDRFPVSPGHSLIISKRHKPSLFDLEVDEQHSMMSLLKQVKAEIENEYKPAGYNIGINDGLSAGQTIPHLHIHIIPRFEGDMTDPRGGVRGVIPEKQKYGLLS